MYLSFKVTERKTSSCIAVYIDCMYIINSFCSCVTLFLSFVVDLMLGFVSGSILFVPTFICACHCHCHELSDFGTTLPSTLM